MALWLFFCWKESFLVLLIFKHLFVLTFLIIGIMLGSELMYFVQLDGYNVKSIYKNSIVKIKDNILNIFMCAIIIFCMLILDVQNIYLCIVYLLVETSLWLWAGNQFEYIKKIKYTKRSPKITKYSCKYGYQWWNRY